MSTTRTFTKITRLQGDVRVPGELRTAAQALWLAAISDGDSQLQHVPPTAAATIAQLQSLGVQIVHEGAVATVSGVGLAGLQQPQGVLELDIPAEAALPALAILAQQRFVTRVRIAPMWAPVWREQALQLLGLLARTGTAGVEESDCLLRLDGTDSPSGVTHEESDLPAAVKLGLLTAGLFADGPTVVREPPSSKDRVDGLLKARGVAVEGSRQADPTVRTITLKPGTPRGLDVDLAGDLELALPFVVAGLCIRRADITIRRVMLRPENRVFIDIVRQIGGEVEIVDADDGSVDLAIRGAGRMKSTRVAEKRAQSLLDHVALLAVLATQTDGEFIIRDIEALREGEYDLVEHLADLLRGLDAKVGEYSYGLVIDGGRPLQGTHIDTRGHAGLAQAFAVAGLVATGATEVTDTDCVEPVFPGFFDLLDALQSPKTKEKTT